MDSKRGADGREEQEIPASEIEQSAPREFSSDGPAESAHFARSPARRRPAPCEMTEIEQLLAYEQIRQLASRYALAVNMRDLDALVELFVDDVPVGAGRTGREALKSTFSRHIDAEVDILEVTTHVINLVDRTHATGTVYSRCEMGGRERWEQQLIAYGDEYERRHGMWYFVSRDHQLFYGADTGRRPLALPPAHWPRSRTGRGTLPYAWPTWQHSQTGIG
ncbi:nuclear transport factor 2 family protein [Nocardia barduliensis]|uniref:nuclear transport factor 2 family protein n=1 Tax=Nocardia barduliensis TaxID=2736643 RepID=UPI001C2D9CB1|nr:nuclear transport factor 2 family protein [Nocardia barduliensis]